MPEQKFDLSKLDAADIQALLYIEAKGDEAFSQKIAYLLHLAQECGADLESVPAPDAFGFAVKFYQALVSYMSPRRSILSGEFVSDEDD